MTSSLNRWIHCESRPFRRLAGRRRLAGIALQPVLDHEVIKLLGPQQPGEGLPLDALARPSERVGAERRNKTRRLRRCAPRKGRRYREPGAMARCCRSRRMRMTSALARRQIEAVPGAGLGAGLRRIHGVVSPVNHAPMEGVLHEGVCVAAIPQRLRVGVVLREQQRRLAVQRELIGAQRLLFEMTMASPERSRATDFGAPGLQDQVLRNHSVGSRCSVARVGTAIDHGDADQDVVRIRLGVFGENVEVAVLVEDAGVDQLEFRVLAGAAAVDLEQMRDRETRPADICTGTSCRSAWAWNRGSSNISLTSSP